MVGASRSSAVQPVVWWVESHQPFQPVVWWVESHQPFIQFFIFHRFWRGKWAFRRLCQWDIGGRHNSGSWGCVTLLKVFSPSQFKSLIIPSWLLHQPANVGIRITWSSLKDSRIASRVRRTTEICILTSASGGQNWPLPPLTSLNEVLWVQHLAGATWVGLSSL